MKTLKYVLVAVLIAGVSQTAFARRGGDDPARQAFKNSQAGFVSESLEHSMRQFFRVNQALKDEVADATVESTSLDTSIVNIILNDGSEYHYDCLRFDDTSRGGTIVKKEVVCRPN